MFLRKILLGALGLFATLPATAQMCTPKVGEAHLIAPGKLQMATNPTLPPQQFVDAQGELQGLNVELGRAVAEKLCLEAVFVRMDRPGMEAALKAGRFDMINTGLFYTDDRSKIMFMLPYGQQAMSVFTSAKSSLKIESVDDLAGRAVGIELGTYQESKSREMNAQMVARGLKSIDFRTFNNASETTAALRAGQLDAAINADDTARLFADQGIAKVWLSGLMGTDVTFNFRDRALGDAVAAALGELKVDGTYEKAFAKFRMTPLNDTSKFGIKGPGPAPS